LEETARLLYQEWFVQFRFPGYEQVRMVESALGMVPEGWEVVNFFDIADILSGGTPKTTVSEYWNGDIPFYTPKDAPASFFVIETEKSVTEAGLKSCNSLLYPKNTVFITARGTVGKIALNAVDMAMNQSCYALEGKENISQFFVFMHIKDCISHLKQVANGAVFDTIIVDTFKQLKVVKPSLSLIDRFTATLQPLFGLILNLTWCNSILRRTRDKLLPKLVAGEIDVSGWVEGDGYEVGRAMALKVAETRGRIETVEGEWRSLWE
ncbi:MAG: restriction endonuclease subunit S, partial [Ktedonobacteraceae bacterium]